MLEQAFADFREEQPEVRLVEAGPDEAAERAPAGVVRITSPDESLLTALLSGASAFLYPSLYEGFGLPVIEAMQAGTPVIATDDPAVREAASGAVCHASPGDCEGWTAAMRRAVSDADWAFGLQQSGLRRASELTWRRTAEATRAIYEQAIRGG